MNSDDNNRLKSLEAMLKEVLDNEPESFCAEQGAMCPFCFEHYKSDYPNKGFVVHSDDCWITRAKKLLDNVEHP